MAFLTDVRPSKLAKIDPQAIYRPERQMASRDDTTRSSELLRNDVDAWDARARDCRTSHGAALWSERGQTARFIAVRNYLSLMGGDTLLDYGAGTGRFCEFLPKDVAYFALDTSSEMRERARREHERAIVIDAISETESFTHVVAIGPFNLRDEWSIDKTWETLEALYSIAEHSLIVSLYRGWDRDCIHYDPVEVTTFAKTLSTQFVVDASYLPNDILLKAWR